MTSDVFFRAFRSWTRYDVERGEVAPWLFRIAQRAVIDWRRRGRHAERPDTEGLAGASSAVAGPDDALLHREDLARVRAALGELTDREREAITLRFASDLKFSQIGDVLEISMPAAKMLVWRAINKLRLRVREAEKPTAVAAAIGDIPDAGGGAPDRSLARLFTALAVAHDHPMPPDLPDRIAACVGCAKQVTKERRRRGRPGPPGPAGGSPPSGRRLTVRPLTGGRPSSSRSAPGLMARALGAVPFTGFGWGLIAPACVACTLGGVVPLFGSFGMAAIVDWGYLHNIGLVLAPLAILPLWLNYRRHQRRLPLLLGVAGVAGILLHTLGHSGTWPTSLMPEIWVGGPGWIYGIRIGAALLVAGVVVNAVAMARWVSREKRSLAVCLAEGYGTR